MATKIKLSAITKLASVILLSLVSFSLTAQYFGRNKPRYHSFDFKVKESEHFSIYHYTKDKAFVDKMGQFAEQWYDMHQEVLQDTFYHKNPLLFYDNHGDFQQTNAISGSIGVGTGGVTEALKNRVVMPYTFTNQQTHHVLGHEMVHAFQYHMIINGDSTSLNSFQNLPLWMVEGLAEYLSIGRYDSHTAMWMRDAILKEDIPDLKDLYNPKYFPYRYGQAFWSFFAGLYGDDMIRPFFENTGKYGLDIATQLVLGINQETLNGQWRSALETYYTPFLKDKKESFKGKAIVTSKNAGNLNIAPELSPNGKYVVFLSEKDLFSTDLYVADARTGDIIKKLSSSIKDGHLDGYNYIESSGAWSPDSKRFAFVAFKKGRNVLIIKEALSGKTIEETAIKKLPAFANPNWSSDGKKIVLSGLVNGQTDLYEYTIKSGRVNQLTDDEYAEIQASYNADGTAVLFATDETSMRNGRTNGRWTFNVAELDLNSNEKTIYNVFNGADNLNPVYDHQGDILFLSDRDGYRNMYKLKTDSVQVYQMTDYLTGVSGITRYSPAITASRKRDRVLYTHYNEGKYFIYESKAERLLNQIVDPDSLNFAAATLPVVGVGKIDIVNKNLLAMDEDSLTNSASFRNKKYSPKFKLDHISGSTGIGIGTSNTFGNYTGLQGGIGALFSDIVGNNQLFAQLALNGEILDAGGQVAYINYKNQLAWGLSLSHLPLRTGYQTLAEDNTSVVDQNGNPIPTIKSSLNLIRIFDKGINAFAHLPFSKTFRLEGSIGGSHRGFRYDIYDDFYLFDPFINGYRLVAQDRNKQETGDEIGINQYYTIQKGFGANAGIAAVGDNSFFGLTSPLAGHRFRVGVDRYLGNDDYWAFLADFRKYFWKKPFSFAVRGMAYTRFENEVNSVYPFFIGDMGFVRGYGTIFDNNVESELGLDFGQLLGSKMGLFNAEIRLPFTGPKRLALIPSSSLFTDLSIFFDAGVAFDDFSHFSDGELLTVAKIDENNQVVYVNEFRKPTIATSAGVSLRINLLGALILEPYVAWPLREGGSATFGLNFVPGF